MQVIKSSSFPIDLKNKIESLSLTRIQKNKVYKLINKLLFLQREQGAGVYDFYPLPAQYLLKLFGTRYNEFFKQLKCAGVIEAKTKYGTDKETYQVGKYCKSYRINTELLTNNFTSVFWEESRTDRDNYVYINSVKCEKLVVENDIKSLCIDSKKLLSETDNYIASINENSFKLNKEIAGNNFWTQNNKTGFHGYATKYQNLQIAEQNGWSLIQDGLKYYIDDIEDYISNKRQNIRWDYTCTIENLKNGFYFINRNCTNHRLDYIFTFTPKILLSVIKNDNDLIEIDLANSQFAILSHLIKNDSAFIPTDDFNIFQLHAEKGSLYSYIEKRLNLSSRNDAKKMMLAVAFCHPQNPSHDKRILRQLFPSVIKYIDDSKVKLMQEHGKNGHKIFAVNLQKFESKLFIDSLYYFLKLKQNKWILTKHDSLIIKSGDAPYVLEYVQEHFKKIKFECTVRCDI